MSDWLDAELIDDLKRQRDALASRLAGMEAAWRNACERGDKAVARLAEAERKAAVLTQVRRWLKEGAILKATDPTKPVLEDVDGDFFGGMTITYPTPDSATREKP